MVADKLAHSYIDPQSFFSLDGVLEPRTALILVDFQNDFITGSLAVGEAEQAVQVAKQLADSGKFAYVVATQDAHPTDHVSFAQSHKSNPSVFSDIEYDYNGQRKGTWGFEIHPLLSKANIHDFVWKGRDTALDSYSAFADNLYQKITPMSKLLHKNDIDRVVVIGLATDFCVRATALDAIKFGFPVLVIPEGCRGVIPSQDGAVFREMTERGIDVARLNDPRVKNFLGIQG
ncbi:hypothetical protein HDU93_005569 [Gonapodya sp. JEL0774]|nr:hypothetical protein HDU93_005569 [Gonapodya sp. JEL0774]